MIVQDIYLPKYDWQIRVYYATTEYFISNVLIDLIDIDCPEDIYFKFKALMESKEPNVGFTYTNDILKCSILFIGITTSADEFQSTYDHEKGHLAMHICLAENINPFSEEYQYLCGKVGKEMFKEAQPFLCEHCRARRLY